MLSWTVWVPAIALSVIAFIGYRRLASARSFLSRRGAILAAVQVAVFVLVAGATSAAEAAITCTDGARRCTSCNEVGGMFPFVVVFGEECEDDFWFIAEGFYDEAGQCAAAGDACNEWTSL